MFPILIIETKYKVVVYIQGNKAIDREELLPYDWMRLGGVALQLGIQNYSEQMRKIYICENDVNVGVDLRHFPDRVEQLHQEVINIVQNGVNEVKNDTVDYVTEKKCENCG